MSISTINPNVPIPNTDLDAVQVQQNFLSAYNDINGILTTLAGLGNMSTQSQNNVTITGGTIAGPTVGLFTSTTSGAVPASGGGSVNFLRSDGTWQPVATGVVASLNSLTGNLSLTSTGGTVTITPSGLNSTINLEVPIVTVPNTTNLLAGNGSGGISDSGINTASVGTVKSVNVSGGSTGLTALGGPVTSSGTITLAGTLGIANGGTGQTTQQTALNALAGGVTSGQFLRGNGTNVVLSTIQASDLPAGTGTVTSVNVSGGTTGLTTSGGPVTTTGTITLAGTLGTSNGGTGNTTGQATTVATINGLIAAGTNTTLTGAGTSASPYQINANAGTVTGTGTATQVAFWNSSTALSSNANLYWDNTNSRLGVGTSSPAGPLHVSGTASPVARFETTGANNANIRINNVAGGNQSSFDLSDAGSVKWQIGKQSDNSFFVYDAVAARNLMAASSTSNYLVLQPGNGNVGIGQTPSATLLQVGRNAGVQLGTVSTTGGQNTVAGVGTEFTNVFIIGDTITINGETQTVNNVISGTSITTSGNWTGTNSGATYTTTSKTSFVSRKNGSNVMGPGGVSRSTVFTLSTNNSTVYSANNDVGDQNRSLNVVNENSTTNNYAILSFRSNPNGGIGCMLDQKLVNLGTGSSNYVYTFADQGAFKDRYIFGSTGSLTTAPQLIASTGTQFGVGMTGTIAQSGTAGYTAYYANITESATGSGNKRLLDLGIAGSSKIIVDNAGNTTLASLTTGGLVKSSTAGLLSNATAGTDYQAPITLTTTGASGAATFSGNTLNVPNYIAQVAAGTNITITGAGTAASPFTFSSSSSATTNVYNTIKIDQQPQSGTTGTLTGLINGSNTSYTVSNGSYVSGTLEVALNGQIQVNGVDWTETTPASGTLAFAIAPPTGSIVTTRYVTQTSTTGNTASNYVVKTSNYTVSGSDRAVYGDISSGPINLTLPSAVTFDSFIYQFKAIGSSATNALRLIPIGGQLIDGDAARTMMVNDSYRIQAVAGNWSIL